MAKDLLTELKTDGDHHQGLQDCYGYDFNRSKRRRGSSPMEDSLSARRGVIAALQIGALSSRSMPLKDRLSRLHDGLSLLEKARDSQASKRARCSNQSDDYDDDDDEEYEYGSRDYDDDDDDEYGSRDYDYEEVFDKVSRSLSRLIDLIQDCLRREMAAGGECFLQ